MDRLAGRFSRWRNTLEEQFKSPEKLYRNACDLTTKYSTILGQDRFNPHYSRRNSRFGLSMIDFVIFVAFGTWSNADGWGDLIDVTFSFVTFSIGIQCGIKALVFTSSTVLELLQYNLKCFEAPVRFSEVRECHMKTAFYCKASVEILKRSYFSLGVFVGLFPIVKSLVTGEFDLPYGFYVPGVNRSTWTGYLSNLTYQMVQTGIAVLAILSSDLVLFNFIVNAMCQLDVIIVYLDKLNTLVDSNNDGSIQELLKELIKKHVEHAGYMLKLDDMMKAGFFLNFGCLIAEAASCLYVLAFVDGIWYPGLMFMFCSIYQLGIACFLGSLLVSKNDQLVCTIYNTPWRKFPIPAQRMMQLLLHQAQNSIVLTDGFTAIDLETFMAIISRIYSYFAMLQEFN